MKYAKRFLESFSGASNAPASRNKTRAVAPSRWIKVRDFTLCLLPLALVECGVSSPLPGVPNPPPSYASDEALVEQLGNFMRACASDREGTTTVSVNHRGQLFFGSPIDEDTQRCAQALTTLHTPWISPGTVRTVTVSWRRDGGSAGELRFHYPIPQPGRLDDVTSEFGGVSPYSTAALAHTLEVAFGREGYPIVWFRFLDGFAVATHPEKIDRHTGAALCRTTPITCERFSTDFEWPKVSLFKATTGMFRKREPMTYRSIVFMVTRERHITSKTPVMPDFADDAFARRHMSSGTTYAPLSALAQTAEDRNLRVHVATYIFDRKENNGPVAVLTTVPYITSSIQILQGHSILPIQR